MKEKKILKKKQNCSFLERLKKILNNNKNRKIIHWSKDGTMIVISNIFDLSKKILPKYFNHKNYSSFVRQLNLYKFHKIKSTRITDDELFKNEGFKKNNDQIKGIKIIIKNDKNNRNENCKTKIEENDMNISINIKSKTKDDNDISKEELTKPYLNKNNKKEILNILLQKTKENILLENENKINLNKLRKKYERIFFDLKKLDNEIDIYNKNVSFGIDKNNNQNKNTVVLKDNDNFENSFLDNIEESQDYRFSQIFKNDSFISNNNYDPNYQIDDSFCEQLDIFYKNYKKYKKKQYNLNSSFQNTKSNNIFLADLYNNRKDSLLHNNFDESASSNMAKSQILNQKNILNRSNMSSP